MFHYVHATRGSEYAIRLTKYSHRSGAKNAVIDVADGDGLEAELCWSTGCERVYVFGPPDLAEHPLCERVHHPEQQYLDLVEDVCDNGSLRRDRTRAGTYAVFDRDMRFDLRDGTIPLLTTKRVFVRGVVEELLWMISGSTDAGALAAKGVHIWGGDSSRAFLDSVGLHHRAVGDLGPVYGFQWRHAGATYVDKDADYAGQGVDQLAAVIEGIRRDPHSRRHVMSAWHAPSLEEMALPPCHMMCQFYVSNDGELSCIMTQRSCDVALGAPFNIASYAILTAMVAQVCGLKPGDLTVKMGDCHVYVPHVPVVRDQCKRVPKPFPKLRLNPDVKRIDDFTTGDVVVEGYHPHASIAMKMIS